MLGKEKFNYSPNGSVHPQLVVQIQAALAAWEWVSDLELVPNQGPASWLPACPAAPRPTCCPPSSCCLIPTLPMLPTIVLAKPLPGACSTLTPFEGALWHFWVTLALAQGTFTCPNRPFNGSFQILYIRSTYTIIGCAR